MLITEIAYIKQLFGDGKVIKFMVGETDHSIFNYGEFAIIKLWQNKGIRFGYFQLIWVTKVFVGKDSFKALSFNALTLVTKNEHIEHDLIPLFLQQFCLRYNCSFEV